MSSSSDFWIQYGTLKTTLDENFFALLKSMMSLQNLDDIK